MQLVIASNNPKKYVEIKALLKCLNIDIVPTEETIFVDVEENGETFAENARKKAEAFSKANHCAALGDDSGLCVVALDGAPGVYSSRFAGIDADDVANNAKLLRELDGIANRNAYFVCFMHITFPNGQQFMAEGRVDGEILKQSDGSKGFAYDPFFYCPELGKTFAQASPKEKASVSHRGHALRKMSEKLRTSA